VRRPLLLLSLTLAAFAVLGGLATGCSSNGGSTATTSTAPPDSTVPTTPSDSTASTEPAASGIRAWWITGDTLTPGIPWPGNGADPVRVALDLLFAGPTPGEQGFGAGTAIPPDATINSLEVGADGIATVDFNRKFETADTRPQTAQVVYTLTQFPQVGKVRFLIDGQPNGAAGVPPVGRSDVRFPAAAG
jgi:hypothetical protein